ncbi:uncharacterized protein LOC125757424 [Rhipicephalus sanguineus]|uniref:uncharacterized protein LOC125757424 n=1 Tax=Rhipicephalus sanguineus TaxID=34632 RepID=UPI0020C49BAD|nr:uncharacterized protein LOC125757424 [Rhipicephalus sanguineus]
MKHDLPETVAILQQSIYVDDLLCGAENEEEATKIYEEANFIFEKASMRLHNTRDKSFGFYVLPKERKLRETWIQRINRAGQSGRFSKFTPTTGHRVCSAHFEGGKKTYMNRVPTIFPLRQQKVEKRRPLRRTKALVKDEKKLRYYTGFTSSERLDNFWSLLEPDAKRLRFWQMKETESEYRNFIPPLKTQLMLVLMRLRLGLDGLGLAYRFGVSKTTVSRIWATWLDFLDNRLCQVPTWMPPQLCDKYRPKGFIDKGYTTVDGILGCTEIFIETPSSFRAQSETYSSYQNHNTAKGLVVCSPNGFVMFVSDLAPGRLSDKALTKACGVLEKFSPGRSVMADRGFTIEEECKQHSLRLKIPPFLGGRPQLPEADETDTRLIASVRIHVERVIRKIKTYKILSHVFLNSMSGQLNKVWHICALLTNFVGEPLLREE